MNRFYPYTTFVVSILLFISPCCYPSLNAYPAIITTPIADLVGSPLPNNTTLGYQKLPLCGATRPFVACPRLHQALFNQYVEVIEERRDQVCIAVPNVFYSTHQSNKPHHQFWTAACTITPLYTLEKEKISATMFPAPINALTQQVPHKQIVTLIEPFHDTITGLTFSAGTRFVLIASTNDHISVYRYDPTRKKVGTLLIPKKQCFVDSAEIAPQERVRHYVALARHWANKSEKKIPYVWGGCSYIQRSKPDVFTEVIVDTKESCSYYVRPDCTHTPQSGLDCSSFICLAAQCCGIPYFLKNSTTVVKNLRPVTAQESIIAGDIIWIPNHVMIVGSMHHNTLIEARHYSHGYGCVHEIPLSAVFKNIKTYQDLHQACISKKPLIRLDNNGNERETISECKILHIMSVWD